MARHYKTLTSEKYFSHQLKQDARKRQNAKAAQLFGNLLIVVVAGFACFYAINTMPAWLPTAEANFHEWTNYQYF